MKKIICIILIILSIFIVPNVNASGSISVESVTLDSKSETTQELQQPSVDGLNVSIKAKFGVVNDYIKYKVIINNPTYTDYKIMGNSKESSNEYIKYDYTYDDGNNIAEKNSKTIVFVTISYIKEVPDDLLVDGSFIESNKLILNFGDNNPPNPNTKRNIIIKIIGILIVIFLALLSYIYHKKKNYIVLLLILLLIPLSVKALEKLQIKVDFEINIDKSYKVTYLVSELIKESEVDNYRLAEDWYSTGSCSQYYYMIKNEKGEYEKYLLCGIFKEDKKRYFPGDRVDLSVSAIGSNEAYEEYCTNHDNKYAECSNEYLKTTYNYSYLYYYKIYNIHYNENDIEVMNFDSLDSEHWEHRGYVGFNIPNKMTMPEHNVYLYSPHHRHR